MRESGIKEHDRQNAQLILLSGFMIMLGTLTFMILLNNLILTANLPTSGLDVSKHDVKEFRTLAISEIEYAAGITLQYGTDNNITNETLLREYFFNYTDVMSETLSQVFAARGTSVDIEVNNVSFTSQHGERTITVQKFVTQEHFFPDESIIIPMDSYQNNVLQSYRFVWNIVNNTSVPVYAVLQDPVNSNNITMGPLASASAVLPATVNFDNYVDVPDTTVTYLGFSTDVNNVGSYMLGQDINVSVYVPSAPPSVLVEILDKDLNQLWAINQPLVGGRANVTIPATNISTPSTYGVVLVDAGAAIGAKPVVVSEFVMDIQTNETVVLPGETVKVTIETRKGGVLTNTSNRTGVELFRGGTSLQIVNGTQVSTGTYEADIVMPSIVGKYFLYGAITTGNISVVGYEEAIGVADGGNVTVTVLNSTITFDSSVNVPDTTVTYNGYSVDVNNVGSYMLGQDINVSIDVPSAPFSVQVVLIDKDLNTVYSINQVLSGGKANITIPNSNTPVPSTYGVALIDNGAVIAVKPVVVSEFVMTVLKNKTLVSPGETVSITIETRKGGVLTNTSNRTGVVLFNGSTGMEFNATLVSTGVYEVDVVMPSILGRYYLYGAVATGNIVMGSYPEVVCIENGGTVDVIVSSDFALNIISDDIALPSMGPGNVGLRSYLGGPFMIDIRNLDNSTLEWIYNESLNFTPPITIHGLRMEDGIDIETTIAINEVPSVAVYPDTSPEIDTIVNYYSDMRIPYTLLNNSDIQAGDLTIDNYSILLTHENMSTVGNSITSEILNWTAQGGVLYAECISAVTMDAAVEAVDDNANHSWFGFIGINQTDSTNIPPAIPAQLPNGPLVKLINSSSVLNYAPPMPLSGFVQDGAPFNQLSQTSNISGMYGPVIGHPTVGIAFTLNNSTGAVNPDTNIIGYISYTNGSQVIFDDDMDGEQEYHLAYVEAPFEKGWVVYMAGHDLSTRGIQAERVAGEIFYASASRDRTITETHNINVTLIYTDGMATFESTVLVKI